MLQSSSGRFSVAVLVAPWLLLAGCGDASENDVADGAVVHAEDWELVEDEDDPFVAERDAAAECDPLAYSVEEYEGEMGFFVDTAACDYLTVGQPARLEVEQGATLHLRLYHYELTAPEPAEAHLALASDGHTIWDETIAIPKDAELIDLTFEVERAFDAGDLVTFHVRNHGDNNYVLLELSKEL